jgi:hypothetical protein
LLADGTYSGSTYVCPGYTVFKNGQCIKDTSGTTLDGGTAQPLPILPVQPIKPIDPIKPIEPMPLTVFEVFDYE